MEHEHLISIRLTHEFIQTPHTPNQFIQILMRRLKGWRDSHGLQGKEHQIPKHVIGHEEYDKFGRPTHKHSHINAIVKCPIDKPHFTQNIQAFLRSAGCKGNKCYSVKIFTDVKDETRWLRYPMKESMNFTTNGLTDDEVKQMCSNAQDERKQQIIRNLKSEEQALNKNQFRDKMFRHLDKEKIKGTRNIILAIFDYYNENGRDAPIFNLSEKAINYEILRGYRKKDFICEIDKNKDFYI